MDLSESDPTSKYAQAVQNVYQERIEIYFVRLLDLFASVMVSSDEICRREGA